MEKNKKWLIAGALVLIVALWYFWEQVKEVATKAAKKANELRPAANVAPAPQQTIAAATMPGAVASDYFQYGDGQIYFENRKPSTYREAAILGFTAKLQQKTAFKTLN